MSEEPEVDLDALDHLGRHANMSDDALSDAKRAREQAGGNEPARKEARVAATDGSPTATADGGGIAPVDPTDPPGDGVIHQGEGTAVIVSPVETYGAVLCSTVGDSEVVPQVGHECAVRTPHAGVLPGAQGGAAVPPVGHECAVSTADAGVPPGAEGGAFVPPVGHGSAVNTREARVPPGAQGGAVVPTLGQGSALRTPDAGVPSGAQGRAVVRTGAQGGGAVVAGPHSRGQARGARGPRGRGRGRTQGSMDHFLC